MIDDNNTLIKLDHNRSLSSDYHFAQILASEMNNFYIAKSVCIPENEIIKIIGKSKLYKDKILMPYQLMLLKEIEENNNVVVSAPTSFGKSFLVLEYMRRNIMNFNKIIYVVHTKSLKDEIYLKLKSKFTDYYYVTDDIDEVTEYEKYIVIIISDGQNTLEYDISVDLLIVDEAYNLSKIHSNERHFCIMRTYHKLLAKAKKTILLGPFIESVKGEDSELFKLIKTNYSPVVQKIIEGKDLNNSKPEEKFIEEIKEGNKTIAYFGSKTKIYKYIDYLVSNYNEEEYSDSFITWMEEFFPDFWLLPKLMKRGIGLYHSAFPKYINLYNMNKFNKENFNGLITTSAILEGVNTSSKSLIIFDSSAGKIGDEINKLTAFQFFNLCGRVGRLGEEIVGYVYNYGDSYKERYQEKSLPLYIGNEDINDGFDELDDDNLCDNDIKSRLISLLGSININYNDWYEINAYYSSGSKNMIDLIELYIEYRCLLKDDINLGKLSTADGKKLNKNKVIVHFYNNYVSKINSYKYTPRSKFYIQSVIPVLLRSQYNGIDFVMKKLCEDTEIRKNIKDLDISDKNMYILELMSVGYNYLPHKFYNICFLFNEFIMNDLYWKIEEKEVLTEMIYDRILLYVNGSESQNVKAKKMLSDMGVIPPTIEKILNFIDNQNINIDNITKSKLINIIIKEKENIKFKDYEIINLQNIGINLQ